MSSWLCQKQYSQQLDETIFFKKLSFLLFKTFKIFAHAANVKQKAANLSVGVSSNTDTAESHSLHHENTELFTSQMRFG